MVGQGPLKAYILVRIQVPQLFNFRFAQISESSSFADAQDFDTIVENWRHREAKRRGDYFIMKFYVYILQCADGSFYVGCTNNLEKRIKQHNESKYTKI